MGHKNSDRFHILRKVLTVCREPTDGWRLKRCTRVPDARAAADMVDDLVCERVDGNARQTLSQLSHFRDDLINSYLHNGEHQLDGITLMC